MLVIMGHGMIHAFTKIISRLTKVSLYNADFVTQHESNEICNSLSAILSAAIGMIMIHMNTGYAPNLLAALL